VSQNYQVGAVGSVTPPADMMAAAKASLTEEGFAELMRETGGASPTPAQLVRIADREREQALTPAELASEQSDQAQAEWESSPEGKAAIGEPSTPHTA
jgi:hypothetical protein